MPQRRVILIGGGGHAGVVFDACIASDRRVLGLLDDDENCPLARTGVPRLGEARDPVPSHARCVVAIGDIRARRTVIDERDSGLTAYAVVHPTAVISPTAQISDGSVVLQNAVVNRDAVIGAHSIVNTAAVVEHDCRIGENVHLAPRTVLGGGVTVGRDTLVGLGSVVLPNVRIGAGCVIGAGAVVVRDVPDGATVAGVPARSK